MDPYHHGREHRQVANREDSLHIWRVVANILDKKFRAAVRGWSNSFEIGQEITCNMVPNVTQGLEIGQIRWNAIING